MDNKIKGVTLTLCILSGGLGLAGCSGVAADQTLSSSYVQSGGTTPNPSQSLTKDYIAPTRGALAVYSNPYSDTLLNVTLPDLFDGNATVAGSGALVACAVDQSVDDQGNPNPSGNFISNTTTASASETGFTGFLPGVSWVGVTDASDSVNTQFCYVVSRIDRYPALVNATATIPAFTTLNSLMVFNATAALVNGSAVTIQATSEVLANYTDGNNVTHSPGPINVSNGNITIFAPVNTTTTTQQTINGTLTNVTTNVTVLNATTEALSSIPFQIVDNVTGTETPLGGGAPVNFTGQAFTSTLNQLGTRGNAPNGIIGTETFTTTISALNPNVQGVTFPGQAANPTTGIITLPYTTYGVVEGTGTYSAINQTLTSSAIIETYSLNGLPALAAQSISDNGGNFSAIPFSLNAGGSFGTSGATNPYAVYVAPNGNFAYVTFNLESTTDVGGTQGEDLSAAGQFAFSFGQSLGSQNVSITAASTKQTFRRGFISTFAIDPSTGALVFVSSTPTPTNSSDAREIAFGPNSSKLYVSCFEANTVTSGGAVFGTQNGTVAEYSINPVNGTLTLANSFVTGPGTQGIALDRGLQNLYVADHLTNAANLALTVLGQAVPPAARGGNPLAIPPAHAALALAPAGSIEVFSLNSSGDLVARTQMINGTSSGVATGISFPTDLVTSPVFNTVYAVHKEVPDPHVRSVVGFDAANAPFRIVIAGEQDNMTNASTFGELQTFALNSTTQTLQVQAVSSAISISSYIAGQRNADHLTADPDGRYLYATFRADPPVYSNITTPTDIAGLYPGNVTTYSVGAPGHFAPSNSDAQARLFGSPGFPGTTADPVMGLFLQVVRR